jgi:hypothetical protein
MYGIQIQRIGLAVAGLALAVSVLAVPTARAMNEEPADSAVTMPLSLSVGETESVLTGPIIPGGIPLPANIRAVTLGIGTSDSGNKVFMAKVKNLGPNRAIGVKVWGSGTIRWKNNDHYVGTTANPVNLVENFEVGQELGVNIYCEVPTTQYCSSVIVGTDYSADPDTSNNLAMWNNLSPN